MARYKDHVFVHDLDGIPRRVGTLGFHGRLWEVPVVLERRDFITWVKTSGNHPQFQPMRRWLKDPHRLGEYCWRKRHPSMGEAWKVLFFFTDVNTAFEFRMNFG